MFLIDNTHPPLSLFNPLVHFYFHSLLRLIHPFIYSMHPSSPLFTYWLNCMTSIYPINPSLLLNFYITYCNHRGVAWIFPRPCEPRQRSFSGQMKLFFLPFCYTLVYSQHIQHPWLLSASDLQRERAVNAILSLLESFRDNMLITVGGVSPKFTIEF